MVDGKLLLSALMVSSSALNSAMVKGLGRKYCIPASCANLKLRKATMKKSEIRANRRFDLEAENTR